MLLQDTDKPKSKPSILDGGQCMCIREPRGDCDLEGFNLTESYPYQKVTRTGLSIWYRVFPNPDDPKYYESCGQLEFQRYFKIQTSYRK